MRDPRQLLQHLGGQGGYRTIRAWASPAILKKEVVARSGNVKMLAYE